MEKINKKRLLEITRIYLIGCQPCDGCKHKKYCLLPQAYKQLKELLQNQLTEEELFEIKAREYERGLKDAHKNQPEVDYAWIEKQAEWVVKRIKGECGLTKLQEIGIYHLLTEKGDLRDLLSEAGVEINE